MAMHRSGMIHQTLSTIVTRPILATLTVGTSILILIQLIHYFASIWPQTAYLHFIVPFIPPFFITRTAKQINQQKAEHDFIQDAEPYIFIAFPKNLSEEALLNVSPDMVSDSTSRHLNTPIAALLEMEALPFRFMNNSDDAGKIIRLLREDYQKNNGYGVLQNFQLFLKPHGEEKGIPFLMNSVLKKKESRIKWQATLIRQVAG